MTDQNLVGRCGLYCGACSIYRGYRDGGEYLKLLSEHFKCPPDKVSCEGCQTLRPESWGYNCEIVQCLRNKSLNFCYECARYEDKTCDKYEELAKGYMKDGEDIRTNMERIRKGETEQWLRECEATYRCSDCGKPLPLSRIKSKCYHCGADRSKAN